MNKEIVNELQAIKSILANLVGTYNMPEGERFSIDALNKAAERFQKLSIERGDWIEEWDIDKVIKSAPWKAGAFIRSEFGFSNFFKRGKKYYYNKEDLIALGKELKDRNIDLKRYSELVADEEKFQKYLASVKTSSKKFTVPDGLSDIVTLPPKAPSAEIIKEHLNKLKEEFFKNKMSEYVDIHKGTHAMMKFEYQFDRYIKPEVKKLCRKWCDNFNYANNALKLLTNKTEKFIPVKDDDMIEL